jgi:hypothetical protein
MENNYIYNLHQDHTLEISNRAPSSLYPDTGKKKNWKVMSKTSGNGGFKNDRYGGKMNKERMYVGQATET